MKSIMLRFFVVLSVVFIFGLWFTIRNYKDIFDTDYDLLPKDMKTL